MKIKQIYSKKSRKNLKGGKKSPFLKKHSSKSRKRSPTISREQGDRELILERLEIALSPTRQKYKNLQREFHNMQIEKDQLISNFDKYLKDAEELIKKIKSSQTNETERNELLSTFRSNYGNLQQQYKEQDAKLLIFVNKQKHLEEEIEKTKGELKGIIEKIQRIIIEQTENV